MKTDRHFDAMVIGAGVIGAAITLELARKGFRTLCVDKLPAAGYGSTSNSCAIIRTHYSTLDGTALAWEGYHHWKDWGGYLGFQDERGLAGFIQTGMVVVRSEAATYEKHLTFHDELGIEYEEWDAEALRSKIPFYDVTAYYPPRRIDDEEFGAPSGKEHPGAVFLPHAGYVNDPQLATHNLQRSAEEAGAIFQFNTEVVEIGREGGRVRGLTFKDGQAITAPVVVNAAGPHSAVVNRMARVDTEMTIRTRPLRKEVHYLPFPRGARGQPYGRLASDNDVGVYSREEAGGLLLVGSVDPKCDALDWVPDPDDFNRDVTEDQWRAQVYRMGLRIPELEIPNRTKGIVDLYDTTDDWIPIYDRSSLDGFYMAVGTSGNQFKTAPMVGRLMAKLIEACESGQNHDADPVQVRGPYTGRELDIGFYSRNREIHQESSSSVLG